MIQILKDAGEPISISQIHRAVVDLCKRDGSKIPSVVTVRAVLFGRKKEFVRTAPKIYKVRADTYIQENSSVPKKGKWKTKEVARRVLEEAGEPMSIAEICKASIEQGWQTTSKDPFTVMAACLYTDANKVGGMFKLEEEGIFGFRNKAKYKKTILYVARNPAIPDYLKVGSAYDLEERMKTLSRPTGVPFSYKPIYAVKVKDDAEYRERGIREILYDKRVTKEFYKEAKLVRQIKKFLDHADCVLEVIEDQEKNNGRLNEGTKKISREASPLAEHKNKSRKFSRELITSEKHKKTKDTGPFNFREIDIPIGTILTFTKDNSITCEVYNNAQVRYKGDVMSLSKAAKLAKGVSYGLPGPEFWQYNGEKLSSIQDKAKKNK